MEDEVVAVLVAEVVEVVEVVEAGPVRGLPLVPSSELFPRRARGIRKVRSLLGSPAGRNEVEATEPVVDGEDAVDDDADEGQLARELGGVDVARLVVDLEAPAVAGDHAAHARLPRGDDRVGEDDWQVGVGLSVNGD